MIIALHYTKLIASFSTAVSGFSKRGVDRILEADDTNKDRGPELPVNTLIDRYLQKQSSLRLEDSDPLPKFEAAIESSSPSSSR